MLTFRPVSLSFTHPLKNEKLSRLFFLSQCLSTSTTISVFQCVAMSFNSRIYAEIFAFIRFHCVANIRAHTLTRIYLVTLYNSFIICVKSDLNKFVRAVFLRVSRARSPLIVDGVRESENLYASSKHIHAFKFAEK